MSQEYHVIVVGAGASGLMAAGQAAAAGANTLLLEKMDRPGRKLRLTGKGRCNLTNIAPVDEFIQHFHPDGRFLHSAFAQYFSQDLIRFFEGLGVRCTVERGGRVFPVSDEAAEIANALTTWAVEQGVELRTKARVTGLQVAGGRIFAVDHALAGHPLGKMGSGSAGRSRIETRAVIVATGGASYPGTGSTGDGYRFAEDSGHTVVPIRPALVPLETHGEYARRLQGLSLRNVRARLLVDGEVHADLFGEVLFTHFGLSGPIILSLSRAAVDALRADSSVVVSIDLKPALDEDRLDARLRRDLDERGKQQYQNLLGGLLPRKLIPVCLECTGIPADKPGHQINAQERERLRSWLKDFRFEVRAHRSFHQAIITAGGVRTSEIDPRSMASKRVRGLYFCGEVLDLDADTGGFNLQAAFSTGWLAGRAAASAALEG